MSRGAPLLLDPMAAREHGPLKHMQGLANARPAARSGTARLDASSARPLLRRASGAWSLQISLHCRSVARWGRWTPQYKQWPPPRWRDAAVVRCDHVRLLGGEQVHVAIAREDWEWASDGAFYAMLRMRSAGSATFDPSTSLAGVAPNPKMPGISWRRYSPWSRRSPCDRRRPCSHPRPWEIRASWGRRRPWSRRSLWVRRSPWGRCSLALRAVSSVAEQDIVGRGDVGCGPRVSLCTDGWGYV